MDIAVAPMALQLGDNPMALLGTSTSFLPSPASSVSASKPANEPQQQTTDSLPSSDSTADYEARSAAISAASALLFLRHSPSPSPTPYEDIEGSFFDGGWVGRRLKVTKKVSDKLLDRLS